MGFHDRAFKQLIATCFIEFLELFFPDVRASLDEDSITFLDKEFFADILTGERREADLVVKAKWRGEESFFLISVEGQGADVAGFPERLFLYSTYLFQKYRLPVYPIVVFYDKYPAAVQPSTYRVAFPNLTVFEFNYQVIQLNKLNWRDFVRRPNPVASALMARMKIAPKDRPYVKLECLRLLASLRLDKARMHLISAYVDRYLTLNAQEETMFQIALREIEPGIQEEVLELTTSWMEQGVTKGIIQGFERGRQEGQEEGRREEAMNLVLRLLRRRVGTTVEPAQLEQLSLAQLEELSEALLDFGGPDDLAHWLARQS